MASLHGIIACCFSRYRAFCGLLSRAQGTPGLGFWHFRRPPAWSPGDSGIISLCCASYMGPGYLVPIERRFISIVAIAMRRFVPSFSNVTQLPEDWISPRGCLVVRLAFLHSRELPAVCEAGAEMDHWRL